MSKGEFHSVKQAVGGLDAMIDGQSKDQDTVALIQYIAEEAKETKVLENQHIWKTPIVRNGRLATVGYKPEEWKDWK